MVMVFGVVWQSQYYLAVDSGQTAYLGRVIATTGSYRLSSNGFNKLFNIAQMKKDDFQFIVSLIWKNILARSSVTGKSKEGQPAWDRVKVKLMIAHVLKYFPKATEYNTYEATMALWHKHAEMKGVQ